MPKSKGNRQDAKTATSDADDYFDRMLAKVTAGDCELPADVTTFTALTASIASSRSKSGRWGVWTSFLGFPISKNAIIGACKRDE
jgi:hypothetical protein